MSKCILIAHQITSNQDTAYVLSLECDYNGTPTKISDFIGGKAKIMEGLQGTTVYYDIASGDSEFSFLLRKQGQKDIKMLSPTLTTNHLIQDNIKKGGEITILFDGNFHSSQTMFFSIVGLDAGQKRVF